MSDLLAAIERHAGTRASQHALTDAHTAIPWRELPNRIETRARMLKQRHCRVVALALDNGTDQVLWDLACVAAGVVCVPLPVFFSKGQRDHALAAAGVDHVITRHGVAAINATAVTLPAGTARVTFTSGTTGTPKGVCLPQAGLERVAQAIVDTVGAGRSEHHLSILPLGVLLENIAGVWAALFAGSAVHVPGLADIGFARPFQPDFTRLLQVMRDKSIATAILVPELLRGLTAQLHRSPQPLPTLRFVAVGGAKIAPALIQRARAAGLPVYEGYGLSECGSVIAMNTPDDDLPGSAGRLLPHVDAAVQGNEIIIRNPLFTGYVGEPCSGPFPTGDLGTIDADGHVRLQGRARNVIITSFGRNISPEWIESVLLEQPEIAQAIVIGDGRPALSALVVPAYATANTAAAIEKTNRSLPDYARIARHHDVAPFTVADGLLTANGRPRRGAILEDFHESL